MEDFTDEEKAVLRALRELEPATLEELAVRSGLPAAQVKEILEGLAKRGILTTMDKLEANSGQDDSGTDEREKESKL